MARPERLRALLGALDGEDVVVVANGASDAVRAVIDAAGVACVRLDPNRGPAAARNAGWRRAASEYVAFTDDDCLPAPGWLDALRAAAAPGVVLQGRVAPLPEDAHRVGPFARTVVVDAATPFFHTANVLYPRALLEAVGGFDEAYDAVAGEDTDLGWRAVEAGATVRFAPDALVWHAVTVPGWRGLARDAARWGTAVRLVKRHPGLRAHFHHRIFWKRSHEALLLAALGLAARRPVLALPYLLVHRREHPSKGSLARALPGHLAVDAAEVAALARGSVRARTLLL